MDRSRWHRVEFNDPHGLYAGHPPVTVCPQCYTEELRQHVTYGRGILPDETLDCGIHGPAHLRTPPATVADALNIEIDNLSMLIRAAHMDGRATDCLTYSARRNALQEMKRQLVCYDMADLKPAKPALPPER